MLTSTLFLYIQSLLITTLLMVIWALLRLTLRSWRKKDETPRSRQIYIYDTMMITIMLVPVLSFATFAITMMLLV